MQMSQDKPVMERLINEMREMKETQQEMRETQLEMKQENKELRDAVMQLKGRPTLVQIWPMLNEVDKLREIDFADERFEEVRNIEYPPYSNTLIDKKVYNTYIEKAKKLQTIQPTSFEDTNGEVFYVDRGILRKDHGKMHREILSVFAKNNDELAQDALHRLIDRDPAYVWIREEFTKSLDKVHLKSGDMAGSSSAADATTADDATTPDDATARV